MIYIIILSIILLTAIVIVFVRRVNKREESPMQSESSMQSETSLSNHPVLGHMLLWGPAGVGKTTLAQITANELACAYGFQLRLLITTPLELKKENGLEWLINQITYGSVIFIDEIHGIDRDIEEALYSVMQDFVFHGDLTKELPRFTLIGATTMAGNLTKPLRDRFSIEIELAEASQTVLHNILRDVQDGKEQPSNMDEYHGQEAAKTVIECHVMSLDKPDVELSDDILQMIAQRSLNNPRIAKQLYGHVRAVAKVLQDQMSIDHAEGMLQLLGIDDYGLHHSDRRVIQALLNKDNKPTGLKALSLLANVSQRDLEDMIEPRLIHLGFLERTPKGRMLTPMCFQAYIPR